MAPGLNHHCKFRTHDSVNSKGRLNRAHESRRESGIDYITAKFISNLVELRACCHTDVDGRADFKSGAAESVPINGCHDCSIAIFDPSSGHSERE